MANPSSNQGEWTKALIGCPPIAQLDANEKYADCDGVGVVEEDYWTPWGLVPPLEHAYRNIDDCVWTIGLVMEMSPIMYTGKPNLDDGDAI
jgi:hypothetical protein